jgi:putative oxidoreductase
MPYTRSLSRRETKLAGKTRLHSVCERCHGVTGALKGMPTMKLELMEKQRITPSLKKMALVKRQKESSMMSDIGLLILRLAVGGLLAGHGTQKLFGWFSGPGLKGTAGWLESLGLKPGTPWATAASTSEFGGGVLTTLGFLHPLGPLGTMGAMIMATVKAHWGKPIWASKGGAELPVINMATALALTLTGPGRFSLDYVLGIRLPRALVITIASVEAATVAIGIVSPTTPPPTEKQATTNTVAAGQGTARV